MLFPLLILSQTYIVRCWMIRFILLISLTIFKYNNFSYLQFKIWTHIVYFKMYNVWWSIPYYQRVPGLCIVWWSVTYYQRVPDLRIVWWSVPYYQRVPGLRIVWWSVPYYQRVPDLRIVWWSVPYYQRVPDLRIVWWSVTYYQRVPGVSCSMPKVYLIFT